MTVRDFTSKCANSFMWVEIFDHSTGKCVRDTARVIDYQEAERPDKNSSYSNYIRDVLDNEVKRFKYSFDFCMEEGFVLYV